MRWRSRQRGTRPGGGLVVSFRRALMNRSAQPATGGFASARATRSHRGRPRQMKDHRDGAEQRVDVGAECLVIHAHGVAIRQRSECVRELVPVWRRRPVHQDGQNADTTSQSGRDLEDDEVVRVVQAALTVLVAGVEPGTADDREKHTARGDGLLDRGREISARLDRVDVDEDVSVPETFSQAVVQAAREMPGVLTPVAQKDPAGNTAGRWLRHDRDSTSTSAGTHPTSVTTSPQNFCRRKSARRPGCDTPASTRSGTARSRPARQAFRRARPPATS